MNRLIEKNKTYRIPHKGKTSLFRVLDITSNKIKVLDLKNNKKYSMSRDIFQDGLDLGTIYVSATFHKAESGLSPILYHWTRLYAASSILHMKEFSLMPSPSDHTSHPHKWFLATTRSKLGGYHIDENDGAIFVLDGSKLGQKYLGKSYDFFTHNPNERKFVEKSPRRLDEMEDRVYFKNNSIPVLPYTKEIHVYADWGKGWVMSGNTRLDAAFILGITPKGDKFLELLPKGEHKLGVNKKIVSINDLPTIVKRAGFDALEVDDRSDPINEHMVAVYSPSGKITPSKYIIRKWNYINHKYEMFEFDDAQKADSFIKNKVLKRK
jgi:hypothetical protein